ncbi:MAG: hypothetical protein B1H40_02500 [Candidatus Latescibacteria bacterium 4484_181]|nr:MAG: hypothetical protein B1H40_02500 [Candidatus Latescibacteria bacterium 4484_181]RKY68087.1 MAG: hypothetical protein DRQ02_05350 [Candidatus Latescibacterota bacterium]
MPPEKDKIRIFQNLRLRAQRGRSFFYVRTDGSDFSRITQGKVWPLSHLPGSELQNILRSLYLYPDLVNKLLAFWSEFVSLIRQEGLALATVQGQSSASSG